ncbi:unnamed protein product [Closterium sp. Naga37s-1]|nr:unnamed protein product [Closterium sp. Naga37s-1]
MSRPYWLVSLPLHGSKESTWGALQDNINRSLSDLPYYKLYVPGLRVGTLDSLLSLSDDLVKASAHVEGVANKMRRQIEELDRVQGTNSGALSVDGVPVDSYMTNFQWDEAKYPVTTPLREMVESIQESVSKIEDDLKVRASEYTTVRSQLSAINRKAGGSMLVRDLSTIVQDSDIIVSEHMTTLLVVVAKYSERDWLASYETLSTFVVPQSSKKITEDNEYALFTVTLFKRVVDTFKVAAREKGFQVREYEHDPDGANQRKEDQERLLEDSVRVLDAHCCHSPLSQESILPYGLLPHLPVLIPPSCFHPPLQVFASWMHIAVIRLFAESILRYGLPPAFLVSPAIATFLVGVQLSFLLSTQGHSCCHLPLCREHPSLRPPSRLPGQCCSSGFFAETVLFHDPPPSLLISTTLDDPALMTPSQRSEKRLRSILETLSNTDNSEHWRLTDSDASLAGLTGGDHDLHPYVSITMSVAL